MTTKDIVEKNLYFLSKEYGFDFEYKDEAGDHYIFRNSNGFIEFYEWEQFGESEIYVKYDMLFKRISLIEEYPQMISQFNQAHKGIKSFFKDVRKDYWEMISKIIKNEIICKNSIFGLAVGQQDTRE